MWLMPNSHVELNLTWFNSSQESVLQTAVGDRAVRLSLWCQEKGMFLHLHEAAEQARFRSSSGRLTLYKPKP